jgi:hypothetical protein
VRTAEICRPSALVQHSLGRPTPGEAGGGDEPPDAAYLEDRVEAATAQRSHAEGATRYGHDKGDGPSDERGRRRRAPEKRDDGNDQDGVRREGGGLRPQQAVRQLSVEVFAFGGEH